MTWIRTAIAGLLFVCLASAQTLGDLARDQRASKSAAPRAKKVYTNDNLPKSGGLSVSRGGAAEEEPADQTGPLHAPDVIFLPTPDIIVDAMLKLAKVHEGDIVYDLGSGDGRLVIAAAKLGAHAVGLEIDPELVKLSRENAKKAGVSDRATFRIADLFEADIHRATVVTLYLGRALNMRLRPKLWKELTPGTRVVSHNFDMGDWAPEAETGFVIDGFGHGVYLWTIAARTAD